MTIRQEMLHLASLARNRLRSRGRRVAAFLTGRLNDDGGFGGRGPASDLYYTVFGLEGLLALAGPAAGFPPGRTRAYLQSFAAGGQLDLVHLCSLVRCWAGIGDDAWWAQRRGQILQRLGVFRSADGGYSPAAGAPRGTVYACFLALGACQDLGWALPDPEGVLRCVESLKAADGGYANQEDLPVGSVPATAAAVTTLRHLGKPVDPALGDWLLGCHCPGGGFLAMPLAPEPDLLSTATALFALRMMQAPLEPIARGCLEFVEALQHPSGGWRGGAAEQQPDCEYTYYALLSLGILGSTTKIT